MKLEAKEILCDQSLFKDHIKRLDEIKKRKKHKKKFLNKNNTVKFFDKNNTII